MRRQLNPGMTTGCRSKTGWPYLLDYFSCHRCKGFSRMPKVTPIEKCSCSRLCIGVPSTPLDKAHVMTQSTARRLMEKSARYAALSATAVNKNMVISNNLRIFLLKHVEPVSIIDPTSGASGTACQRTGHNRERSVSGAVGRRFQSGRNETCALKTSFT